MITSEISLLDTNILVYAADRSSPNHEAALLIRDKGLKGEVPVCVCPQVLNELFAIITDPKRVNNPRTHKEALMEIEKYLLASNILKIYAGPGIIEKTTALLKHHKVTKQDIFDLQLVATMLLNNVTSLYTYNQEDFSKFKEIKILTP
jgi:predicted nucleic acid-binding protein